MYGGNVTKKVEVQHEVFALYPNEFANDFFIDHCNFGSSLKLKFSENFAAVLKQKYEFEPRSNEKSAPIQFGFFSKNKSHSYYHDI